MANIRNVIYGAIIIGFFVIIHLIFPRNWSTWLQKSDQMFAGARPQFITLFVLGAVFFFFYPLLYGIFFLASFGKKKYPEGSENFLPGISVIIPALNEEMVIGGTLESYTKSGYPKDKLEILAVASGSTDKTVEICQKYQNQLDIKILMDPLPKKGKPAALNVGLKHATHAFICVFDADNHVREDTLQYLVRPLYDPEVTAAQGGVLVRNWNDNTMTKALLMDYSYLIGACIFHEIRDRLGRAMWLLGRNYCIRKTAVEEFGGWNEDALTEDLHLSVQLLTAKKKIKHASDAISDEQAPNSYGNFHRQRDRWIAGYKQGLEAAMELNKRGVISRNLNMLHYGHTANSGTVLLLPTIILGVVVKDFYLMFIGIMVFVFTFGLNVNGLRKYVKGHYRFLFYYPIYFYLALYMFIGQFKNLDYIQWDKTEK